jgi:uncharacterized protein (DUF342 family)
MIGTGDIVKTMKDEVESFLSSRGIPSVETAEDVLIAEELRSQIKGEKKKILDQLTPYKNAAYESWQGWNTLISNLTEKLSALESELIRRVKGWKVKDDARREEERLRLLEEKKKEEKRLAEEKARIDAEARAKEEARLATAVQLESQGDVDGAEAVMGLALDVQGQAEAEKNLIANNHPMTAFVAPKSAVKLDGRTFAEKWRAEVYDIKALCRAVAEGKVLPDCVLPNMAKLNQVAKISKRMDLLPGVRGVKE